MLDAYPNVAAANCLRDGFSEGFRLGFCGPRVSADASNPQSIKQNFAVASGKLDEEVRLGRMAGPFLVKPIENLRISPIGLIPKSVPGSFRLIHNLSYPASGSVNDGINKQLCTVHYSNFDDAVNLVVRAGAGALLAKADIKSAFRLLPIHPEDFCLLGVKLSGSYYVDKALPMGASCAPALFETFSTFLEWVIKKQSGYESICHYADDFLFVGRDCPGGRSPCLEILNCFRNVCMGLGVPLAEDKTVGPTTQLTFLGLEINSVSQTVSVPGDKLLKISEKVLVVAQSKKVSLRSLQSLVGSLSFICRAVAPGRAFLRRLIDLMKGVKKPWHLIPLSQGAKADLSMWQVFLQSFNGKAMIPDQYWIQDSDLQLFTDASGGIGFGGYFGGQWFRDLWPQSVHTEARSIAWLEFFPVVVALTLWGESLSGKRVLIRSDNQAVVAIINNQTSKCPHIMKLVRFFVLQCLRKNVSFKAKHIPGVENNIADALSRSQIARFKQLAPSAARVGLEVPEFLWRL